MTSGYFDPYGGTSPGPRFFIPALPFLVLGLTEAFVRWPLVTTLVALVSAARVIPAAARWNPGPDWPTLWTQFGLPAGAAAILVALPAAAAFALALTFSGVLGTRSRELELPCSRLRGAARPSERLSRLRPLRVSRRSSARAATFGASAAARAAVRARRPTVGVRAATKARRRASGEPPRNAASASVNASDARCPAIDRASTARSRSLRLYVCPTRSRRPTRSRSVRTRSAVKLRAWSDSGKRLVHLAGDGMAVKQPDHAFPIRPSRQRFVKAAGVDECSSPGRRRDAETLLEDRCGLIVDLERGVVAKSRNSLPVKLEERVSAKDVEIGSSRCELCQGLEPCRHVRIVRAKNRKELPLRSLKSRIPCRCDAAPWLPDARDAVAEALERSGGAVRRPVVANDDLERRKRLA